MLETEMLCYVPTYRNVATLSVICWNVAEHFRR